MAPLINSEHDLLDVLFTLPQQLDREGTARDDHGFPILQEFASLRRFTRHEPLPVAILDVDNHFSFKLSFRSKLPLAIVKDGFSQYTHFRVSATLNIY